MRTLLLLLLVGAACAFIDLTLPEIPKNMDEIDGQKISDTDVDCPRHRCHHHFPPPPFLKKVSHRARREFYRIAMNKDTTANQKMKQLDDWAKKQGDDILNDLHDYEKKIHQFSERIHDGMVKTTKDIPNVYNKVHEILSNHDLTPRQIWEKLTALKLDPISARSLRAIYFFVIHQRKPGMQDFQLTPAKLGQLFGEEVNEPVFTEF